MDLMFLPQPRGPLTEELFGAFRTGTTDFGSTLDEAPTATGADAALALWVLYELHYRGFAKVDDELEWDPQLLTVRRLLERDLEARLRSRFVLPEGLSFVDDAFDWIDEHDGPSLARHVHRDADLGPGPGPAARPVDLPPQGGRPGRLAGPAARGANQGCADGAPVRRVRRRRPEPAAPRAVRQGHGCQRPGPVVRGPPRRRTGRGARAEQRVVPARAAPQAARRRARPPRGVRGDQRAAVAPDGRGAQAPRLPAASCSTTTPSTSRPTPCTSSSRCA